MGDFLLSKEKEIWQKILKKIPWFYHLIFIIIGLIVGILFQILYIKHWNFPYFFIFIIATLIIYCVLFLLFSIFIKQNWFWKKNLNKK